MPAATAADPNAEQKERLIATVKKEVKQLMEEVNLITILIILYHCHTNNTSYISNGSYEYIGTCSP